MCGFVQEKVVRDHLFKYNHEFIYAFRRYNFGSKIKIISLEILTKSLEKLWAICPIYHSNANLQLWDLYSFCSLWQIEKAIIKAYYGTRVAREIF